MKFAVVGGDERSVILCNLFANDGHLVRCFALEKAEPDESVVKTGCIQGCVYGADCVVLPVPAEKAGMLNSPLSDEQFTLAEIVASLWPGQLVLGGKLSREFCALAHREDLYTADIMSLPEFTVGNAALTAEGALEKLMATGKTSLWKSNVLITGWGRIASILALRLLALGAKVGIAARNPQDRAMAEALGCRAFDFEQLEGKIGGFEYIVNTVPHRVIKESALCCVAAGSVLMELASPPGGFDRNLAENIGLKVLHAPGLPGKCAPYSAAKLMKQAVYALIKEQEGL